MKVKILLALMGTFTTVICCIVFPIALYASPIEWNVNHHYYEAVSAPAGISWEDANAAAIAAGGYLATISSTAENSFIFGLVDSAEYWGKATDAGAANLGPWLGGAKIGDAWTWVTNEPFIFTNWSSGEPNNQPPYEDRLEFFGYDQRLAEWNDYSDARAMQYSFPHGYVIEFDAAPVPIPGAVWLLSSGLAGLIGLKRKHLG